MTSTTAVSTRPTTASEPLATFGDLRRDRVIDLIRVGALGVVIVWHSTLSLFHRSATGVLSMPNPIGSYRGLWMLTWLLQVMPLFFVVSGAVNADAWDRHRRRGGSSSSFARHRVQRFVAPLAVLGVVCVAIEALARSLGSGAFMARHLVILVPLWTLALLMAYAPVTPALQRGWDRWGMSLTVGLVSAVVLSDLVRFRAPSPAADVAKVVSTLGVWLVAYHLGWVYRSVVRSGPVACRSVGRTLAMVGLVGLVVSTNVDVYPRSMVATSTDAISNLLPTTVPIAALALLQCGVLLMVRPRLAEWLGRADVWLRVEFAGAFALPAYLLHMFVVVAMVVVAEACGVSFGATPTPLWWLVRPLWLAGVVVLLAPLLRGARRVLGQ